MYPGRAGFLLPVIEEGKKRHPLSMRIRALGGTLQSMNIDGVGGMRVYREIQYLELNRELRTDY